MKRLGEIHYGWIVAGVGVLVLFACIGLARFSYTALIPGIHEDLGLGYDQLGIVGTGNFIGYLLAVACVPKIVKVLGYRSTIGSGLLLIACGLFLMGFSLGYFTLLFLFFLVGMGSGLANLPMMALISVWFQSAQRGKAAGLVICGDGLGIIFVGYLLPGANALYGAAGWRYGLGILGAICLAVAFCAVLWLRNSPVEKGLCPVGWQDEPGVEQAALQNIGSFKGPLLRLGLLYFIFGATIMVYGTFIVTTMINEYGLLEKTAGKLLSWIGFFSCFSGVVFGALSDRIGRRKGLCLVFAVQSLAYLLVGLNLGTTGLVVSAVLYGVSVFAPPAIVAAAIGDYFGTGNVARVLSLATFFFAFGQTMGPAGAGLMAGKSGFFSSAYLIAAFLTLVACFLSLSLPVPPVTLKKSNC